MKRSKGAGEQPTLSWKQEHKILSLEGEPVLEYHLSWPELSRAGLGGRWINRYYAYQAKCWRLRWQREVYWSACLDLVARRAQSRPFVPWSGALSGEVTCWEGGILSIRLEGEEKRGDGKLNRVRWGDIWKVKEGSPVPPRELVEGGRRWKRRAIDQVVQQGREQKSSGAVFLDPNWEEAVPRFFPKHDLCLTDQGIEAAFPQGSIGPAAEGTPVFLLQKKASLRQNGGPPDWENPLENKMTSGLNFRTGVGIMKK